MMTIPVRNKNYYHNHHHHHDRISSCQQQKQKQNQIMVVIQQGRKVPSMRMVGWLWRLVRQLDRIIVLLVLLLPLLLLQQQQQQQISKQQQRNTWLLLFTKENPYQPNFVSSSSSSSYLFTNALNFVVVQQQQYHHRDRCTLMIPSLGPQQQQQQQQQSFHRHHHHHYCRSLSLSSSSTLLLRMKPPNSIGEHEQDDHIMPTKLKKQQQQGTQSKICRTTTTKMETSSLSLSTSESLRLQSIISNKPHKKQLLSSTVVQPSPLIVPILPVLQKRRDMLITTIYSTLNSMLLFDSYISPARANVDTSSTTQATTTVTNTGTTSGGFRWPGSGTNTNNNKNTKTNNNRPDSLYAITPEETAAVGRGRIAAQPELLTPELCLLRLLPISKRTLFRELQSRIEEIGNLKVSTTVLLSQSSTQQEQQQTVTTTSTSGDLDYTNASSTTSTTSSTIDLIWNKATDTTLNVIRMLDNKRVQLEPVFIQTDSTMTQIMKNERFEILIETLRNDLIQIVIATQQQNLSKTLQYQKSALLTLSGLGELLVPYYPYRVPSEGKYSYLPRLLGRTQVTFTIRRGQQRTILGNITIMADGYIAPITAGNFVDLCERNFYTGLPIKFTKKRVGGNSNNDFDVVNLPIWGSYNEGFYDPLTGKLRRLPLEIIRVEQLSAEQDLTYSTGLSSLTTTSTSNINVLLKSPSPPPPAAVATSSKPIVQQGTTSTSTTLEPRSNSKPLLSFKIPGLVAMYHPDRNYDGASSEFFILQKDSMIEEKRGLLDGQYAPFGYVVQGYDLYQRLQPNDIIDKTYVDSWGYNNNLIKLRKSSFTEVVQSTTNDEDE